jgi:hypothetical protein
VLVGNDWVYLRQIGGNEAIKLALDFHDDDNDARFVIEMLNQPITQSQYPRFLLLIIVLFHVLGLS